MAVLIRVVQQTPAAEAAIAHVMEQRFELRQREASLTADVARLEAQRPVLERQLRDATSGPLQMAYQEKLAQLDLQLTGSRAELDAVRVQIAQHSVPEQPHVFTEQPIPMHEPSIWYRIDPDAITAVFVMLSMAVIVPLALALTRRFGRRPAAAAPSVVPDLIVARLDRVDQALDAIAIEVERVSESQRYMARMLAEQAAEKAKLADASALGEGKPILALGAGAIEPIRVAERQGVKQSITPH